MKKYAFSALVLIAVASIGVFSFSPKQPLPSPSLTAQWFEYVGGPGGENNPENYEPRETAPTCPEGVTSLCAIYVDSDGNPDPLPDATALSAMQTTINAAIGNGDLPTVKVKN